MQRDLQKVAEAALAWNRARLLRIAVRKALPEDVFSRAYLSGFPYLDSARKAEARAKANLRKACAAADPGCTVIDVQAFDAEPELLG